MNKVNEYQCAECEKKVNKIEYIFPFNHVFEDLNIPNITHNNFSLHNFHMNVNTDVMMWNWPQYGKYSTELNHK